ncbi:hypothetical protein ACFPTY_13725 [Halomonas beimenensis]|uniref:Uncharacterized protein n=1 Tax=Halomonas beimenensis TaxID=475662 RepID=A0A291PB04_9GAMM|nr:hypothetical protein BEI_3099 [Halomonas beimenensis]
MNPHLHSSQGGQRPASINHPLAGSRRQATWLLASLAEDDLVRPELRNDAILASARRTTSEPAAGTPRATLRQAAGSRPLDDRFEEEEA